MREVKFRAWDKITKQIFEVKQIDFNAIERNVYGFIAYKSIFGGVYESLSFRSFNNVELMQYTGLKDKHGKKIYDGDIIEISYKNSSIKQNAKVVYEKGCFFADLGDRIAYYIYEVDDKCEVIGNIYENKELLK